MSKSDSKNTESEYSTGIQNQGLLTAHEGRI